MSRHEHTGGHAPELLRSDALADTDSARTLAGDVAERATERAQASPSRGEGDLGDRKVSLAE